MPKSHMVRIDDRTYRALEALAAKQRRSVASLIALILDTHLDVQEAWPD